MTHPKDAMVHEGDIWSPYKNTRVHNQGRKNEQEGIEAKSSDQGKSSEARKNRMQSCEDMEDK
jgi:hypothetical protein